MLDGLKTLDLTHYVAGAFCDAADGGAGRGGHQGGASVAWATLRGALGRSRDDVPHAEKGAPFLYLNTGKKSITLNLKHSASKPIMRRLLEWADVLVENFRPGVMERLGLDYESVAAVNPGLVMTSVSNFGQTGPYRDYGAREINLYAMGGLMYITGDPEREPLHMAARLAQYGAGQNAFAGTMGALLHRDISGAGQHVDVAISEYLATILENALSQYSYTGSNFRRTGNRGYGRAAWGPYPCRDGYVGVIAGPDHKWPEMAELMGIAELADERFGRPRRQGRERRRAGCADAAVADEARPTRDIRAGAAQRAGVRVCGDAGGYFVLGSLAGARVFRGGGACERGQTGASDDAVESG